MKYWKISSGVLWRNSSDTRSMASRITTERLAYGHPSSRNTSTIRPLRQRPMATTSCCRSDTPVALQTPARVDVVLRMSVQRHQQSSHCRGRTVCRRSRCRRTLFSRSLRLSTVLWAAAVGPEARNDADNQRFEVDQPAVDLDEFTI